MRVGPALAARNPSVVDVPPSTALASFRPTSAGPPRSLIAGVLLFNWYGMRESGVPRGQYCSVWPPADGRQTWDGSPDWYDRHLGMIEDAGFDYVLVQIPQAFAANVRACLRVLARRRRHGSKLRAAPYLAWETWDRSLDLQRAPDRAVLNDRIRYWAAVFRRRLGDDGWQRFHGRPLLGLWHVPGPDGDGRRNTTIPPGVLGPVRSDLADRLGAEPYITAHEEWREAGIDQVDHLFNGMEPFKRCERPDGSPAPAADLLPGFWHSLEQQDYWLPRRGGDSYREAWSAVEADQSIEHVLIESYNEIHEGSSICPCEPLTHTDGARLVANSRLPRQDAMRLPCAGVAREDRWGKRPELYLDITRDALERIRKQGR